ncbi:AfsR/SARP family transcriptional regulator [Saccharothrix sp. Mg75]|uniref:AfsR/SARP family transcriptional regulator n=1 Tax=Saccharothrix sp. Mg75 TaxID=3445357 RepID=UPI003EED3172
MRFGVLGPLAVWAAGGEPVRVPEAKVRLLLADLLVHEGRPVSADRLAFDLWGDEPPGNPVNTLQTKVSQLRRALGAAEPGARSLVRHGPAGYALAVGPGGLDLLAFRELVAAGRPGEALALWRGAPLAEFDLFGAVTARWEEERLAAVEAVAEAGGADPLDLAAEVARHPLRERLRGLHMRALYRAGRQVEALAAYAELRALLAEEQGLEPGPELTALHRAILTHDPALTRDSALTRDPAPTGPAHVRGPAPALGHLPGARPAVPAPAADPPATAGSATVGPATVGPGTSRSTLPLPLTGLVGRAGALAELPALLGRSRLVTLTGPGGVGKTSLAVEVARRVVDDGVWADRVWLVELAGVARDDLVTAAVAEVLGVREDGGPPGGDLVDRVVAALRGREALVVLDNCERLVEPVAALVSRLLRSVPGLRVLTTSQEPLALAAEVVWQVPPLDLADSVELFAARAAASAPGFALTPANRPVVEEVCRRLDGLPLAVELAATRVRGLGVDALLDRLADRFRLLAGGHRDAPARQRTLRAMIDWSWDLLDERERAVLRRLSVHVDGCSLDAAEFVCAGGAVAAEDVLDLLTGLVNRSLVVAPEQGGEPRFRLLESVADYGRERLREAGEAEGVARRHAGFHLALAERADPLLRTRDQVGWLRRLDADAANLRAAHDALDPAGAARMTRALTWYWFLRGRLRAALDRMTSDDPVTAVWRTAFELLAGGAADPAVADLPAAVEDPAERARARWFLGYVLSTVGDPRRGEELNATALAEFEELGDGWGVAVALSERVGHALAHGRVDEAREAAERSARALAASGERWGQLKASFALGVLAQLTGDYERAAAVHREGLRVAEELRSWPEVSYKLSWLGRVALLVGDLAGARELHGRARRAAVEHGFVPGEVFAVTGLALGARREGRLDEAEEHLRWLLARYRRAGFEAASALVLAELGFVAEARGDAVAARGFQERGLALARAHGDPRAVALGLEGLAGALVLAGDAAGAARLLGAAAATRDSVGVPLPVGERFDVDRIAATARTALGEPDYRAAFDAGTTMDITDNLVGS